MSTTSDATDRALHNRDQRRASIPVELQTVGLCLALGLLLTMLAFAGGYGAEIGQALAAAG
jgi:hypothetical protein